MPVVKFITAQGDDHLVNVNANSSVMEAARDNGVPGIDGDCGGCAACGTCHVHIDSEWIEKTGHASDGSESDMLEFVEGADEFSRLACQISITEELDGLIVRLPLAQH
jgi:2Fe-2S ferredoxin